MKVLLLAGRIDEIRAALKNAHVSILTGRSIEPSKEQVAEYKAIDSIFKKGNSKFDSLIVGTHKSLELPFSKYQYVKPERNPSIRVDADFLCTAICNQLNYAASKLSKLKEDLETGGFRLQSENNDSVVMSKSNKALFTKLENEIKSLTDIFSPESGEEEE